MCRIMEEFGDEMLLSVIKNLMESTQWTAEQAMNALKITPEQRKRLAAKL